MASRVRFKRSFIGKTYVTSVLPWLGVNVSNRFDGDVDDTDRQSMLVIQVIFKGNERAHCKCTGRKNVLYHCTNGPPHPAQLNQKCVAISPGPGGDTEILTCVDVRKSGYASAPSTPAPCFPSLLSPTQPSQPGSIAALGPG